MFANFNFLLFINDNFLSNSYNFSEIFNKPKLKNSRSEFSQKFSTNFPKFSEHLFFRTAVNRCFVSKFMKSSGYLKYDNFGLVISKKY